jgi:hypothetical protein
VSFINRPANRETTPNIKGSITFAGAGNHDQLFETFARGSEGNNRNRKEEVTVFDQDDLIYFSAYPDTQLQSHSFGSAVLFAFSKGLFLTIQGSSNHVDKPGTIR